MLKTNSLRFRANARLLVAAVLVLLMARPATALGPIGGGLECSWAETDTRDDGTTFLVLLTFTRDLDQKNPNRGEATATYINSKVQLQPSGHGVWGRTGENQYAMTLWFLDSSGTYVAAHVHKAITVNDEQTAYTGTFQTQVLDAQGNVLQTLTGKVAGSLIPIPTSTPSESGGANALRADPASRDLQRPGH